MHPVIEHRAFSDNVESGLPQENALLNKWRIFCSQNRYPPSDQVRGHALAEYALRSAFDANGCPENNFSRSAVVRFHFAARPGRDSDPRQSGRTGRPVPRSVRARTRLGRTRRDRRTMPVGLHAGAEHGAERPHLRDASRHPRIPRRAVDRSARPNLCRAASVRTRSRSLPIRGARLDPPPRRPDIAPVAAARARTCGDLSRLQMKPQPSAGQLTIQGMPNRSTHMPNPLAQNVLPNGMFTAPPSARAVNLRSPSLGSSTVSETEKPCGWWKWPGGASDAISTSPSIEILACMIFFFHSGGTGIDSGAPSCVNIASIFPPRTFS